ncbi:MAG: diguanylate cyclase domain-containing protein [Acholeplasmataceae bacterium]
MSTIKRFTLLVITVCLMFFSSLTVNAQIDWDLEDIFTNLELVRFIIDVETQDIVFASQSAMLFYGYSETEFLSMKVSALNILSPEDIQTEIDRASASEQNYFIFKHRLKDGSIRDVQVYSYPFEHEGRDYLYTTVFDVTESVRQQRIISVLQVVLGTTALLLIGTLIGFVFYLNKDKKSYEYLANHDILTGARSRLYFEKITKDFIVKRMPFEPFAFVMIDIDHFKQVNDFYGHVVGDQVLKFIVDELYKHMPSQNKIYRYGGDEFILFIQQESTLDDIEMYMKELVSKLHANTPFAFDLVYSYGIQMINDREDLRSAIKIADSRMYKMKDANNSI